MILANSAGIDGVGWCIGPWNSTVPIASGDYLHFVVQAPFVAGDKRLTGP